jgi:hypothetical protein
MFGTNRPPLLDDIFLYSYEADFIQGPLKKYDKKLDRFFNFTFHYIDDILQSANCYTDNKCTNNILLYILTSQI